MHICFSFQVNRVRLIWIYSQLKSVSFHTCLMNLQPRKQNWKSRKSTSNRK